MQPIKRTGPDPAPIWLSEAACDAAEGRIYDQPQTNGTDIPAGRAIFTDPSPKEAVLAVKD